MDTLCTFWDNITHYKTKSVHCWGLLDSATKVPLSQVQRFMLWARPEDLKRLRASGVKDLKV